eukprot:CAMPEP_0174250314 /NCGR_PEP_ID=MMETSP0439-20130205/524_1 /TAXON_ID=0 /ORGANISM="Stereomyxa ramosa, Strain Chinc5" /LENGTH=140 /DNA_ID=CAMNT_0015330343 /DNA_START=331 /DNA_END=754 /DNA_ORIENTATION=-
MGMKDAFCVEGTDTGRVIVGILLEVEVEVVLDVLLVDSLVTWPETVDAGEGTVTGAEDILVLTLVLTLVLPRPVGLRGDDAGAHLVLPEVIPVHLQDLVQRHQDPGLAQEDAQGHLGAQYLPGVHTLALLLLENILVTGS